MAGIKLKLKKLPVYTDSRLDAGQAYTTLDLNDQYYEKNEIIELVNDKGQVTGTGKILEYRTMGFDYLDYKDVKDFANDKLHTWADLFFYCFVRFGRYFIPSGDVQLIKFEVTGSMKFDDVEE